MLFGPTNKAHNQTLIICGELIHVGWDCPTVFHGYAPLHPIPGLWPVKSL